MKKKINISIKCTDFSGEKSKHLDPVSISVDVHTNRETLLQHITKKVNDTYNDYGQRSYTYQILVCPYQPDENIFYLDEDTTKEITVDENKYTFACHIHKRKVDKNSNGNNNQSHNSPHLTNASQHQSQPREILKKTGLFNDTNEDNQLLDAFLASMQMSNSKRMDFNQTYKNCILPLIQLDEREEARNNLLLLMHRHTNPHPAKGKVNSDDTVVKQRLKPWSKQSDQQHENKYDENRQEASFASLYQSINTQDLKVLDSCGVPNDYLCAVTQTLMTDPVCIQGANNAIQWLDKESFSDLQRRNARNPYTQGPLVLHETQDAFRIIEIIAYGKARERMKELVRQFDHDPEKNKNINKMQIALFGNGVPKHQHIMYFLENYENIKNRIVQNEIPTYLLTSHIELVSYFIENDPHYQRPGYIYDPNSLNQELWWVSTAPDLKVASIPLIQNDEQPQYERAELQQQIRQNRPCISYTYIGGIAGFFIGGLCGFGLPLIKLNWVNSNLLWYAIIGSSATLFGTAIGVALGKCKQNKIDSENENDVIVQQHHM